MVTAIANGPHQVEAGRQEIASAAHDRVENVTSAANAVLVLIDR